MKVQKKLNVVLIVLIILLLSIVSFVGVFYQNKNQMVSRVTDYNWGTDLDGYRNVILTVSEDDEDNTEDVLTAENYELCANIVKKRLNTMKVEDYTVRVDEESGQIEITLPENNQTDYILADITQKGKFEIIDTATEEVLMNNDDVKSVDVTTETSSYSSYTYVYMDINFTNAGAKKFKNITQTYQNVVSEDTTEDEETSEDETTEEETTSEDESVSETEETESTETTEETESTDETAEEETSEDETEEDEEETVEVELAIDGTSMMTTTFSQVVDNGTLSLTLGSASDEDEITELTYEAESLGAILENGAMPIQYEITGNVYISSPIEQKNINLIIIVEIAIAIIICLATIIKFRGKGFIIALCSIGYIAVYLLILRYTNVVISLLGLFAICIAFVINHIFNVMLLNNLKKNVEKSFETTLKKFSLIMLPVLILSVVCCFSSWCAVSSFGMVIFWGLIVSIIYNVILTRWFIKSISK